MSKKHIKNAEEYGYPAHSYTYSTSPLGEVPYRECVRCGVHEHHWDDEAHPIDPCPRGVADLLIEALPERVDLIYIGQGDGLTQDQVSMIVRGDTDSLFESFEEWESDARFEGMRSLLEYTYASLPGSVREAMDFADFDNSDCSEMVTEAIYERGSGQWLRDLIRNTGRVAIRVPLMEDVEPVLGSTEVEWAEHVGITDPSPTVLRQIRSILAECGDYGAGYALAYVDLWDVYNLDRAGYVKIERPALLISNPYAGDGWADRIDHDFIVPVSALVTDADAPGYSWNTIAGPYWPAYEAQITQVAAVDTAA